VRLCSQSGRYSRRKSVELISSAWAEVAHRIGGCGLGRGSVSPRHRGLPSSFGSRPVETHPAAQPALRRRKGAGRRAVKILSVFRLESQGGKRESGGKGPWPAWSGNLGGSLSEIEARTLPTRSMSSAMHRGASSSPTKILPHAHRPADSKTRSRSARAASRPIPVPRPPLIPVQDTGRCAGEQAGVSLRSSAAFSKSSLIPQNGARERGKAASGPWGVQLQVDDDWSEGSDGSDAPLDLSVVRRVPRGDFNQAQSLRRGGGSRPRPRCGWCTREDTVDTKQSTRSWVPPSGRVGLAWFTGRCTCCRRRSLLSRRSSSRPHTSGRSTRCFARCGRWPSSARTPTL